MIQPVKTCGICGFANEGSAITCVACGEATWLDEPYPASLVDPTAGPGDTTLIPHSKTDPQPDHGKDDAPAHQEPKPAESAEATPKAQKQKRKY